MKRLITICAVVGLMLTVNVEVKAGIADPCLLLHFDGADGAPTTVDSSLRNHPVSLFNGAQLDTAYKAIGSASLLSDGVNDYASSLDSPDWDILADNTDWTIDFFARHNSTTGIPYYLSNYQSGLNRWGIYYNNGLTFKVRNVEVLPPAGTLANETWYWIALCKVGDEYALYLDGAQVNYALYSTNWNFNGSLYIGTLEGTANFFNGNMDELRIFHGNVFDADPESDKSDIIRRGNEIPEPATIALLGLGVLSLLRRKIT